MKLRMAKCELDRPMTQSEQATFDQILTLTDQAAAMIAHGCRFEASLKYEEAAQLSPTRRGKAALLAVARELLEELRHDYLLKSVRGKVTVH